MKSFKDFIVEDQKYIDAGVDVPSIKNKIKHHSDQASSLSKELDRHNKTSTEYRSLSNDINHHYNAANSYRHAHEPYWFSPLSEKLLYRRHKESFS